MPTQLPILHIDGQSFFLDAQLQELRAVDNPHHRITLTEGEIIEFLFALRTGPVSLQTAAAPAARGFYAGHWPWVLTLAWLLVGLVAAWFACR